MTKDEALKLALEALEQLDGIDTETECVTIDVGDVIDAIEEALAQPEQGPVAYDKTEMNCFVQDLYDKKMLEGKHGHYETMFHVVHQAIKKVPPQRTWVGLMRGVRVEGDTLVITVKGGNDVARELCGALIEEMNK